MKVILCCEVKPEHKSFLTQLSQEKGRSVSNLVDTTISDLKKSYERMKSEDTRTS